MSKSPNTHEKGRYDERFVLQALHDLRVGLGVVPGEVDAVLLSPGADLEEAVLLHLDDLQLEVGPKAVLVELNRASQTLHFDLKRRVSLYLVFMS